MNGPAFRFRAQPALDHRQREDDEAKRALAAADAALRAALARMEAAEHDAAAARTRWTEAVSAGADMAVQLWYRSWIVKLDGEREALAAAAESRRLEHAAAAAARQRTYQRVKALERFKEKSALAWQRRLALEEQKHLDALATIRFVSAARR